MSTLRLGSIVPDFEAVTTKGPIKFHEWIGSSWAILFSHPADFTPVCTTELGAVAKVSGSFADRDVKIIGLSVDDVKDHESWISDINEVNAVDLQFPIIADSDRKVARLYQMLDQASNDPTNVSSSGASMTVRSVFIIDPSHTLRLSLTYPASCGRSIAEILRTIDSLQLTDKARVTTPADWKNGEDVIVHPGVTDEEAEKLFPGYKTIKPYLRLTPLDPKSVTKAQGHVQPKPTPNPPSTTATSSNPVPLLHLGDTAPDFSAITSMGPIESFHTWAKGSWTILFSHPADFTPVCTTELGAVSRLQDAFTQRNTYLIGLSVDSIEDHETWLKDVNEVNDVTVSFPVIADHDRKISVAYGMLDDPTHDPTNIAPSGDPMTVRSVFFIDPSLRIRATLTYPATCGRNFGEILRVLDSLQLTDSRRVTTPANWFPGDPVIIHPGVSNEEADKLFPGYKTIKPYLRTTRL